ncbi:MAG: hypothetical protein N2C14_07220 [Planctomycetales bacterium]
MTTSSAEKSPPAEKTRPLAEKAEASVANPKTKPEPKKPRRNEGVNLLAAWQREARFIDFP